MDDRTEKITRILHHKLAGTSDRDLRFFRVAEFERMTVRTIHFSEECKTCQYLIPETEAAIEQIAQAIHYPGKQRRNYDRLTGRMAKHQRQAHGYFPPYFFTYNYSFYGMLGGPAAGLLAGFVIFPEAIWYFILSGFVVGLLAGQLWGGRKDNRIRVSGKLL
ncbi:MAG: hypothetical protein RBS73_16455 [Prolixibacteraceae bacterium]|jgi:hypothetical protein|nr:hypothetical protein [Prolixibacteraceae bacterium]